jgi:hypothetical protein
MRSAPDRAFSIAAMVVSISEVVALIGAVVVCAALS